MSNNYTVYTKNGKLYLARWFRKDLVIGLVPPDSKPAKTRQRSPQGPPKEGE